MVAPNSVAENVFGTLGAVFWSGQLAPQLWKSWRRKDTAGLSTTMMFLWYISGIWLGAYCYTSDLSIPLIIQPQLFTLFSTLAWAQCLHYDSGYSTLSAWVVAGVALAVGGAVEAGLVVGCRHLQDQGNERLNTATGVIAAVFVIAGLLPQYYEVFKFKAVIGISLIFLSIDLLGGVWSLLSLVFSPPPFDALAAVSYSSVVGLEIGIFILAALLNPRYWRNERARKLEEEEKEGREGGQEERERGEARMALDSRESTLTGAAVPTIKASVERGPMEGAHRVSSRSSRHSREGGFGWLGEDEVGHEHSRAHEAV
ncbi:hypothetical protein JCM3775_006124 [Rhodotorula graminis]|uniref:Uncharacterized protein n=1 Tax=Rhodotorula graminis (strain WP1) TaxID=578459 RepID=A0A194S192_RHOGW|nr:uncharacterized protein RHOBADRAFT_37522 [Rhodotorula graminis WP1]KPV74488.1 hypothetical protein RHOBADRAFT_37522 [Rhodotorula graminis WP1]